MLGLFIYLSVCLSIYKHSGLFCFVLIFVLFLSFREAAHYRCDLRYFGNGSCAESARIVHRIRTVVIQSLYPTRGEIRVIPGAEKITKEKTKRQGKNGEKD